MTYIGSMAMAGMKAMSDERRIKIRMPVNYRPVSDAERIEQERIQGFCPEGVEDFAAKWFGAVDPVVPVMSSDDGKAQACAEAFRGFAEKMAATTPARPYLAVPRPVRTEVELLREQVAAQSAELAAAHAALAAAFQAVALVGQTAEPAQHPLKRAVAAWGGSGGINQLTGKPSWV